MVVSAAGSNALFNANSAENRRLIEEAVSAAVAAAPVQDAPSAASSDPDPNRRYDVAVEGNPFRGAADAQVVMVEFSDFNCGFCGRYARETLNPLVDAFGDRVKFVYRDFPILAQSSYDAALAAQCAFEQGDFWGYHNALFNNQGAFGRDLFLKIAADIGLDGDSFTDCLDNQKHRDSIVADAIDAQNLGLRGTPSFFINGRFVSGAQPYNVFADILNQELENAANPDASAS